MSVQKKKKDPAKVVTGKVRLSYVHLFEPFANDPEQEPKYSVTILIPKSDEPTMDKVYAAIEAAKEEGRAKKFGGRIPGNLTLTLHDGDDEADLERNPEYAGHMYMAMSSKTRPGVVDMDLNPILDATQVYSGCYARVAIKAFPFSSNGNKGISFGLNNVQFIADGDPLGGITRAEDDFSDDFADDGDNLL
jgi:hypothetical protein